MNAKSLVLLVVLGLLSLIGGCERDSTPASPKASQGPPFEQVSPGSGLSDACGAFGVAMSPDERWAVIWNNAHVWDRKSNPLFHVVDAACLSGDKPGSCLGKSYQTGLPIESIVWSANSGMLFLFNSARGLAGIDLAKDAALDWVDARSALKQYQTHIEGLSDRASLAGELQRLESVIARDPALRSGSIGKSLEESDFLWIADDQAYAVGRANGERINVVASAPSPSGQPLTTTLSRSALERGTAEVLPGGDNRQPVLQVGWRTWDFTQTPIAAPGAPGRLGALHHAPTNRRGPLPTTWRESTARDVTISASEGPRHVLSTGLDGQGRQFFDLRSKDGGSARRLMCDRGPISSVAPENGRWIGSEGYRILELSPSGPSKGALVFFHHGPQVDPFSESIVAPLRRIVQAGYRVLIPSVLGDDERPIWGGPTAAQWEMAFREDCARLRKSLEPLLRGRGRTMLMSQGYGWITARCVADMVDFDADVSIVPSVDTLDPFAFRDDLSAAYERSFFGSNAANDAEGIGLILAESRKARCHAKSCTVIRLKRDDLKPWTPIVIGDLERAGYVFKVAQDNDQIFLSPSRLENGRLTCESLGIDCSEGP